MRYKTGHKSRRLFWFDGQSGRNNAVEQIFTPRNSRSQIIFASLVGTTIEFYDFYIYATAAVSVFPTLFFPASEGNSALLASMATFGVAFLARPVGSIIFGHFGDRIGRKTTLVGSLLLMGLATFMIGLLPPYQQAGLFAPILLTILRFSQGLGLGGEWSGAALLATETAERGKRARAAMWPQLGAPFGFILANGFFLILTYGFAFDSTKATADDAFLVWGWRIPFLVSIILVMVGLYVRLALHETPVFVRAAARGERVRAPLLRVFAEHPKQILLGTLSMVSTYGIFYTMTTWILSYAIGKVQNGALGIGYRPFLILQLVSVLFFAAFIPVSGYVADRIGRRRLLMIGTGAIVLFGLTFGPFLSPTTMGSADTANLPMMLIFLSIGMTLMGLVFGPMAAFLPELFPTHTRYTGSGVAYNVASILGAALTPFVATYLAKLYGPGAVGFYLSALGVITLTSLYLVNETRDTDLETMENKSATLGIETSSP
jgi:metabolite-proton symporter